ncbi:MAG: cupredoxin domain-containing protein [Candidatus Manganitrophus sp. SA1]|nr:cupredoxin domain-containing protein [Candidatus Manganitrophus morganii]
MRRFIFLFALISLIGTTTLVEANINKKLRAPKYPKLVDQRPEAPKLIARDDYYSPRFLQVKVVAGNEISLENKGINIHGLVIPALSQINVIRPGESKKIPVEEEATPGMYDFFCHLHPRMRGTIEILPKT